MDTDAATAGVRVHPGVVTMDQEAPVTPPAAPHHAAEAARGSHAPMLNKMRAAVLGANDGVVSTAGMVMGVAGATTNSVAILTAGIAGLTAGALSMAVGEYVSVSAQRDTERSLLDRERHELATMPEEELIELAGLYEAKGLTRDLSFEVARQLTEHDALGAHAEAELKIDPDELTSPTAAAVSSMIAFTIGAMVPLLAMVLTPPGVRVWATVTAVVAALVLTGWMSARVGGAPVGRAVARLIAGGVLAMAVTYGIGALVGTQLG